MGLYRLRLCGLMQTNEALVRTCSEPQQFVTLGLLKRVSICLMKWGSPARGLSLALCRSLALNVSLTFSSQKGHNRKYNLQTFTEGLVIDQGYAMRFNTKKERIPKMAKLPWSLYMSILRTNKLVSVWTFSRRILFLLYKERVSGLFLVSGLCWCSGKSKIMWQVKSRTLLTWPLCFNKIKLNLI